MSQRRLFSLITLSLLTLFLLVACERPLPGSSGETDEQPTATTDSETDALAPSSEDTANTDNQGEAAAPEEGEPESETPREEEAVDNADAYPVTEEGSTEIETSEEAEPEPTAEEAEATDTEADSQATGEEAVEAEGNEAGTGAAEPEAESSSGTTADSSTTAVPETHTVAGGENLYRIGLKYGISWVSLAQHNNLSNANKIMVGQVLKIPSDTNVETPQPTPSPQTEEVYTVKAGDNLYRIGLAYSISWAQIAEANGIVNPNQIVVGQQLKIPIDKPSSGQQPFMHTVQPGETLFLISLRYGIAWPAVAEENDLTSPYVIFPGQTLAIPGK